MQIQNQNTPIDPAITRAAVDNQISIAVAVKAREAQIQEGKAVIDLVKQAAQLNQQLNSGHIDVRI